MSWRFLVLVFQQKKKKIFLTENRDMERGGEWIRLLPSITSEYVVCLMRVLLRNEGVQTITIQGAQMK